jgi:hypothetical protein
MELLSLSPEHYQEAASYLASFPQETRGPEFWRDRFRLWWEDNPAFFEDLERGWILKANGAVVGFLGNIPSYFQLSGEKKIIYSATTWRVSPGYRNHSLDLLFKQIDYSRKSLLFLITVGEVARRISQMLRFQILQRGDERVGILVIHSEKFLGAFVGKNPVTRFLAKGLALILDGTQALRLSSAPEGGGFTVKELVRADASFDELWKRTEGHVPNTNVRTAEVINWYCFGSKNFRKRLFGVYRGPSLLAYVIFINSQVRGLNLLECLDFWGETEETAAVKSLFRYLKDYGQKNSIDLITFPSFSREVSVLFRKLCLFQIKSKRGREYFKADLEGIDPISPENTYFSYSVGDFGL